MKLYGISGLGADKRVFEYLDLDCKLIPIEWIEPLKNETIESYSIRISKSINREEDFGIMGVSFGGLVAVEISKRLNPKLTILISSAETKLELRLIYRIIGKTKLLKLIPQFLFDPPRIIADWIFGAVNKKLLNQILNDTDLYFAKWAVNQLTNWSNIEKLSNPVLKIGGTHDKLIPPNKNQRLIEKGEHFMIVDRADEISQIINEIIRKTNRQQGV
jgi:pimeloyl-ACP methyl ester carboxylesterase